MQNGYNTFGYGPFMNQYCGDNGSFGTPCPTEYANWNTPYFGGHTNGWNTPYFGGFTNGWNTPYFGGYTNGWNGSNFGGFGNDWNTPSYGGCSNGWNTPWYGGQSFGGFGGYAPNPGTVPGNDPAQNAGGPFWTGSCVTEAA